MKLPGLSHRMNHTFPWRRFIPTSRFRELKGAIFSLWEPAQVGVRGRDLLLVIVLQLLGTLSELAALLGLVPVYQYIATSGDVAGLVADHDEWKILVDTFASVGMAPSLANLLGISFAFLMLRQFFTLVRLRWSAWVKESAIKDIRRKLFAQFLYANSHYQENEPTGVLINDLTIEVRRGFDYLFTYIMLVSGVIVGLTYVGFLLTVSVFMTIAAVIIFGVTLVALRSQMRKSSLAGEQLILANQKIGGFLAERFKQARLVRLAGMEGVEIRQLSTLTNRQKDAVISLLWLRGNIIVMVEPVVVSASFVFLYVNFTVFDASIEEIGLFLAIVLRLMPNIKEIAQLYQGMKGLRPSFIGIITRQQQMTAAREVETGENKFTGITKHIRFEDVTFTYRSGGDVSALRNVNLDIPAGRMVALVGPSGAGKSTLIDFLPRLRIPDSGRILFDGLPQDRLTIASLRAGIAYAPQEPQFFNVSVAEHIRYGKSDATLDEVVAAAKMSGAHDFIQELPHKYDTLVGDNGAKLSGGQRQRLDFARALVRNASIMLLDEPTSNLDADAEEMFRDALLRIRAETRMTVLIIGHRLSTVAIADQIVVLMGGEVIEQGSHGSLLKRNGWYAQAFAKQQAGQHRQEAIRRAAD